jgi:hypothetical protein
MLALIVPLAVSTFVVGQDASKQTGEIPDLEKQLWQVELQWLAPHEKTSEELLQLRRALWTDQFFEIVPGGKVISKTALLAWLTDNKRPPGGGPVATDFKLQAVYENFALATDHTTIQGMPLLHGQDTNGEYTGLRMFVKEKGKWRVAGAAFVRIQSP